MTNSDSTESEDSAETRDNSSDEKTSGQEGEDRKGWTEMVFTVLSLILMVTLVGYLVRESLRPDHPAAFELKPEPAEQRGDFITVRLQVKNTGDDTAKAVQIRGEIPNPAGEPLQAEATMDWLPGKSKRDVTLVFSEEAATSISQAQYNIAGYEEP